MIVDFARRVQADADLDSWSAVSWSASDAS